MALTPWEPPDELVRQPIEGAVSLRDVMNRLFEDSVISPRRFAPFGRVFPVDVRETDTDYVIEAALAGFEPEELQVTALENTVTIQATRKGEQKTERTGKYVRQERYEGEVSRTIGLPGPIDLDKVTATYEQGVLTLHVPKTEAAKVKPIKVQSKESTAVH
jgi:HSP20 family protein